MAFYLVTDGRENQYGERDSFVIRAGGKRQAAALAPLVNRKDAEVVKLDDGRDVPNGVVLSSLVDFLPEPVKAEPVAEPETIATVAEETVEVAPAAPRYAVI
ncbi:hypothetical protein CPT_Sycamore_028 [Streptomyces phage Sycamore]|uniref:Uncharacterized protein n=1 Tax=Streptomyces phage Sycamore TaxID=2767589 RepID=A0A873WHG7_9CAUD|nr:hypothetical protein CPT_Sycamore_028 [Streptomyces phage Sycamore]